jgi:protein-S-isoprenylcysteine O-methyltransferase Ste14
MLAKVDDVRLCHLVEIAGSQYSREAEFYHRMAAPPVDGRKEDGEGNWAFGDSLPGGSAAMHLVDIVILLIWVAFWIYWLAAAGGVKEGRTRWARFAGARVVFAVIFILLVRSRVLGETSTTKDPWLQAIGLVVFLLGLALAIWARVNLGGNWGMPMTEKVEPDLITTGPYRRVRHPIYSGIILAMIGTTIAVSVYWLVAVAVIGVYFVISAFAEERFMVTRFPDAYPRYQGSTKMLVPFVF